MKQGPLFATPAFVQGNYAVPQSAQTSVSVPFNAAQTAGNLAVVIVGWADTTAPTINVTDSRGNTYQLAVGPTVKTNGPSAAAQSIYYAKNIAAGSNTVTVTFSPAADWPDIRVLEYSGIDTSSPVDVVVAGSGTTAACNSGNLTTTSATDLLVAGNDVSTLTTAAGAGFTSRMITNPDGDIAEDRVVTAVGTYSGTATLSSGDAWVMQLVAFKAAVVAGDTTPPTAPSNLTATAASATQINLAWTAATDNIGVTGYLIERCQGASCSNFAQVATTTGAITFNDTGLTASTSYSYRVRATDAAANLGPYSGTATAVTPAAPDTTPPSAPSNLTATAASATQINLAWTAATDNVGVTGYRIERCQGAGCSNFAQVATTTGATTFNDTGLTASTSYSYRVRATDAAANLGAYSNTATAVTPAIPDTTPPSAPSNLTATAASSTQINLSWTAATDNVGVTGYLIERCQGAGCSNFAQVATTTGATTFSDMALTATTSYSYRVRATDAAANLGAYSGTATAVTLAAPDTTPPSAPSNLTATAASATQINLSWTAATDDVGVTGYRIERCQGAGCSSFAQVATTTGATTFSDMGLTPSTSYSYRVRANDGAGNLGPFSGTATAVTPAAPDTTPPTAPTNLTATAASSTQINLAWTAATDNVGVTAYLVERCQGAGCSNFAQVAMTALTTFNDTGLPASTSFTYRLRATDAAGNLGPLSGTATATTQAPPDTTPPSAPSNLAATAASSTQINLTWTAATDNVGVTAYLVERCQGAGCSSFAQVGTSATTAYSDGGRTPSTSYSYRVRAQDAAANLGAYSGTASATTLGGAVTPAFVQAAAASPQTAQTTVTVTFPGAQTAGNLNVVFVGWADATTHTISVTDSRGNSYQLAAGPTLASGASPAAQSAYYAKNIAAGANTITLSITPAAAFVDLRALEYSGIDPVNALDVAVSGSGTATTSSSGAMTTTNANDLLVAANDVSSVTNGPGTGFVQRQLTADGDITEDRLVTATGSYTATAALGGGGPWVMQMMAFRAGSGAPADTTPPSAPSNLTATAASMTQINLAWTAATDDTGVTGYLVERCQGAGCSSFAQIGTTTGATAFNDTGLTSATSYSYRVRARDAANNLGPYSGTATATTLSDTTPPSAPSGMVAMLVGTSQITVGWNASTDNVGVTGYLVERCDGAGCSSFAQVGTSVATSFSDLGLAANTSYSYRVRATDAAGNLGPYGATVSASTPAVDTTPPSAPSGLTATVVSSTQINLAWTGSTDDVAVTAYLIERCQGSSCSNFAQINSTTLVTFINTGLAAGTTYLYRVRATDAAGNLSGYSNTAGGTTSTADTTPPSAPTNLTATVSSGSQIDLAWTAATDNVGLLGYLVERCLGTGCTGFTQIAAPTATAYSDTGLAASSSYSYRVRAVDLSSNLGPYSNVASGTTPGAATPLFVQGNYAVPQTAQTSVPTVFNAAQGAGDLNVVIVGWADTVSHTIAVTDSRGNSYQLAVGPTLGTTGGPAAQSIYYAKNIAAATAGANTVTVTFTPAAAFADIRILEYSGIDTANPLDGAVAATGSGTSASSGPLTTTNTKDLLVAGSDVTTGFSGPGAGFAMRFITNPDGDLAEDEVVNAAGAYVATAPLVASGGWVMQMAAFKAGPGAPPPPPDTVPPVVTVTAPTGGATLSGNATVTVTATDNVAVTGVSLVVDGLALGAPDIAAPYSFTFNTANLANGAHTISAYAWDAAHNFGNAAPVSVTFSNASAANPAVVGFFTGLQPLPIVSVNTVLLSSGKVLMWDGQTFGADARVWDPATSENTPVPVPANVFCSGMDELPDGRIFVAGGHSGTCHIGLTAANIFNPATNSWTVAPDMAHGRWYPTATTLADGRIIVLSGEDTCRECFVGATEIYDPVANTWSQTAPFTFPYYPHAFVLPDGRLLVTSTNESAIVSQVLNLQTSTWSAVGGPAVDGGGAAMYLPWKFIKTGTSVDTEDPVSATQPTAYVLDMTQTNPTWRQVASMAFPRTFHLVTLLPDGNVLVTGGGPTSAAADIANAQLTAEMWSPTTETWTTLARMNGPRIYHSEALLLPDGRVLISGSGRNGDTSGTTDEFNAEFYWPPYLFKGPRPAITSAPAVLQYNQTFTVQTPDAARIAKVQLMRNGQVTHAENMSQRLLPLSFTVSGNTLTVTGPVNANLAPPGHYMLFLVDTNGVPSVAAMMAMAHP